ncbi:MAG: serine/threonine protein kinase [bacterium]|nr:serine/threonine protein kinase [bacterium]
MTAPAPSSQGPEPDWPAVRALFERCLELEPRARATALADAPTAIRSEAQALLAEVEGQPNALDPEAGHRQLIASAEGLLASGRTIAGYRILSVLGHGGMSTVYLAEQEHPRRRVALKLVTSVLSGAESRQRFQNEGEVLARLRHPGIAQIHSAGVHAETTAMGRLQWPYFVMEYVENARPIDGWVRNEQLDDRAIVALFLDVCAAIQHAHERGVVHRDLKPHNVLVDGDGQVKVIDFGVARSLEGTRPDELTRTGDVIGTLHYMSPEQVRGENVIDTRTDVHALGVLLFELLTGRLPFDFEGQGLPEIGRILTDVEARPLRSQRPEIDHDLELIVQKALAKLPAQRYSTAGALADDLARFLADEPINARAPSLRYQLRMFARRRRGFVTAVLTVIAISLIGGISSVVYAVRAHRAEQLAVEESAVKDDALRRTFDMTLHAVLDLPRRLRDLPHATELRATLISEASKQLAFLEDHLEIAGGMRLQLAQAYFELGNIQRNDASASDGVTTSMQSYDRSAFHLRTILDDDPDDRRALHVHKDLEFRRGTDIYNRRRDMTAAEGHWATAKATLDRLATMPPTKGRDLRRDYAYHEGCMASVAVMEQDIDRELEHLARSRDYLEQARTGDPDNIEIVKSLGITGYRLGMAHARAGDQPAQLAAHKSAVAALQVAEEHPGHIALRHLRAKIRTRYGFVLAESGDVEAGEAHMRWGYRELLQLRDHDPQDAFIASSFALACSLFAEHLTKLADGPTAADRDLEMFGEAREVAREGLAVSEQLIERSRDMQVLFVRAVCRGIVASCDVVLGEVSETTPEMPDDGQHPPARQPDPGQRHPGKPDARKR